MFMFIYILFWLQFFCWFLLRKKKRGKKNKENTIYTYIYQYFENVKKMSFNQFLLINIYIHKYSINWLTVEIIQSYSSRNQSGFMILLYYIVLYQKQFIFLFKIKQDQVFFFFFFSVFFLLLYTISHIGVLYKFIY